MEKTIHKRRPMSEETKIKKSWIDAELEEHGHLFKKDNRLKMAKKIAKDHVSELGCDYYPELFKLEKRLKRR